jgi:Protein of unknown function (DUF4031)
MAVYVDAAIWSWCGLKWCHLLADDTDELHRFAARLGIKRSSFQCAPKATTPHYDLTAYERSRAVALGALACSREEILAVRHRLRRERLAAVGLLDGQASAPSSAKAGDASASAAPVLRASWAATSSR